MCAGNGSSIASLRIPGGDGNRRTREVSGGHRTFVDVSELLYDLRKIKHPEEVRRLRNAARVFDKALAEAMAQVGEGTALAHTRASFDAAAIDLIRSQPDLGDYQGTFGFNSIGRGDVNRVRHGDIVKVDAGVRLNGYWSDCARVFCCGPPSNLRPRSTTPC